MASLSRFIHLCRKSSLKNICLKNVYSLGGSARGSDAAVSGYIHIFGGAHDGYDTNRGGAFLVVVYGIQWSPGLLGDLLSVKGRQTTLGPGEQLTSWLPTRSLAWVYTQCGTGWRGRTIVEDQAGRRGGRLKTQILVPKILGAYLIVAALYQIGIYFWPGSRPNDLLDPRVGWLVLLGGGCCSWGITSSRPLSACRESGFFAWAGSSFSEGIG